MSFGAPGGQQKFIKPNPPERGSFPLDHDGECKPLVGEYLRCVRRVQGQNAPECRDLAKRYLQCRMEHNLMAPDELKNLGFKEEPGPGGDNADSRQGEGGGKSAAGR